MRGAIAAVVVAAGAIVLSAAAAAAHTEWEPADAAPGSVVDLTLFVEDEQPDAGTIKVELFFPEPLTVAGLPEVPGWTATAVTAQGGGPATGVVWDGGPAPDDVMLPITLGPLPAEPGRLQFKVIQTYDNGTVERWIDEWPEGAPEPPNPGPVLGLVPGAAGSIPATTAPATTAASTTTTTAATAAPEDETAAEDTDDDSGTSPLVWLIPAAIVVAVAGAYVYLRRRRAAEADAGGGDTEG
ncbi:MAG TPA: DUF1775 domain-containing protein [Acidimicrobiales bacterium]|jgi:uncharacterized protein YcnI|nr:DUF1775 domain-containing protein [Acidimicrobiales bacterium]